jgi:hypothetical protein
MVLILRQMKAIQAPTCYLEYMHKQFLGSIFKYLSQKCTSLGVALLMYTQEYVTKHGNSQFNSSGSHAKPRQR